MAERFFFTRQPPRTDSIVLLSGPSSSGKTSLLFQFAFNSAAAAADSNGSVVILCNRRKLEYNPPFISQGVDPSSDIFQRIQIKYVDDDEGIKNYFAAFHLHQDASPVTVIIDDFGDFFDERTCQKRYNNPRGRDLAMVRVLALCRNAIDHANNTRSPCELLLSDTHKGDSPRLLYIYKRWVSSIYTIKGDGLGSFILRENYVDTGNARSTKSAKYSIALQYLVLEDFVEESEH